MITPRTDREVATLRKICEGCARWSAEDDGCSEMPPCCRKPRTESAWSVGVCPRQKWPVRLTIGMACRDDYQGVFFTVQALRMYHDLFEGDEIIVVDNNPDSEDGQATKKFIEGSVRNGRYIPYTEKVGTTAKEQVILNAANEAVLVIDCHVLLKPGALDAIRWYHMTHPDCRDLIQGPLLHDGLMQQQSHFKPAWGSGMYGQWDYDRRVAAGVPFEIPMQGMGLFSTTKSAWPGFHPLFRGFAPEEWYVSQKYRQRGDKVLCHPKAVWVHRFGWPTNKSYAYTEEKCWNYLVACKELGIDEAEIGVIDHFAEIAPPREQWEALGVFAAAYWHAWKLEGVEDGNATLSVA